MSAAVVVLLAFLIGVVCGLRSLTGPALVCWGAELGWLHVARSHLAFLGRAITVGIVSLLAVGELIADKLPKTPRRTAPGPLTWRVLMGGMCGAACGIGGDASVVISCLVGALGGLIGAFAGYWARRALTAEGKLSDFPVALVEDLIAVGGGLFLVSRF